MIPEEKRFIEAAKSTMIARYCYLKSVAAVVNAVVEGSVALDKARMSRNFFDQRWGEAHDEYGMAYALLEERVTAAMEKP